MKPISNMYYKPESHTDFTFTVIGDWELIAIIFALIIIYFLFRLFRSKR